MITKARETTHILTFVSHFSRLQSSVSVEHRKTKKKKKKKKKKKDKVLTVGL